MQNTAYFKNKRITVVGLGRSGLACANLLYDLGAKVSVTDNQDNNSTRLNASKLKSENIKVELGRHSPDFISHRDMLIVSPGVSDESLAVRQAETLNIPLISEIEFSWILCPSRNIIAITGTNGKTTVTTLIGKILEVALRRAFVCGNIGNPFCAELAKIKSGDFVSLEVSSFQLEKIRAFRPKIAVLLNFSPNHLDRYKDMPEYLAAKKRIFMNQDKTDYLVLNAEDPLVKELGTAAKANIVYFPENKENLNPNQAAVLAVGSILGINKELIFKVFRDFKGVEHRLEYVAEINNVKFFNDSKSTTVDSTVWALKNISNPVVLIAGGREKGNDYSVILDLARQKLKQAVLIGEAKEKIQNAFMKLLPIKKADTLEEAVNIAFLKAGPGDCVLFSPMCKSFDMFSDYEERGRVFKQAVYDLVKKNGA